jgi:hypothetical protein
MSSEGSAGVFRLADFTIAHLDEELGVRYHAPFGGLVPAYSVLATRCHAHLEAPVSCDMLYPPDGSVPWHQLLRCHAHDADAPLRCYARSLSGELASPDADGQSFMAAPHAARGTS